jgi:hypothetical protein
MASEAVVPRPAAGAAKAHNFDAIQNVPDLVA